MRLINSELAADYLVTCVNKLTFCMENGVDIHSRSV